MKNELVGFKGMGDGVRNKIDAFAEVYEILEVLEDKIRENRAFFGDGNCNIKFEGRRFTQGEMQRFEKAAKRLLPSARVSFVADERKKTYSNDWIAKYKEKSAGNTADRAAADTDGDSDIARTEESETDTENGSESQEQEFYSVFRSRRARFYEGIVHDGTVMRSDGHLILLGRAEVGSELIAAGHIVVIGGLYGSAHAGCNGHNGSYIMAMDMRPERLCIAGTAEEYTYPDEIEEEEIQESDKGKRGLFGKLKRKTEETAVRKPEKTELSAVALLKNTKIELNNFTIHAFTNPENMI